VLAENASGTIANFATDMNAAAKSLGMNSSYFVNPNGLYDPRQIITARDLGLLAKAMLAEFPEYQSYYGLEHVDIGRRRLFNRNMLIRMMEEADGMKTGFVCDSGFNLVATAKRGERRLVVVVLGTKSGYSRALLAKSMLEQGFATATPVQSAKLAEIVDQPIGLSKPVDMTSKVCRNKEIAEIIDPTILSGWGVSFGLHQTAGDADDALHRNMLTATGLVAPGYGATYRPIDKSGFIPVLWGMDQASAQQTCDKFRSSGTSCSVVPEQLFELYGELFNARLKSAKAAKPTAVAQGSDSGSSKKKIRQKTKSKTQTKPANRKSQKKPKSR
jgi:D-alanyl-D-alanine carboxypeptidase